ncbi:hypothetical protein [Turneriella parva]|uniref:Uncharacterized protein n=1 Tax=Turneriella parva (strain ATCC BAA-1111 / DSM 21527 / NCTC 11395 / H) TaxID=869212 RepID=I4BAA2_TURPD|nr:hypothetical protein [Turneriella parva]AFM14209.1 hypothetical protein Turpa_3575 [Turneriella parva DSM 21527]
MNTQVQEKSQVKNRPATTVEFERWYMRSDTPFQNGTLEFKTRQFSTSPGHLPLSGNYRENSRGLYENLEFLEFLHSTITQVEPDGAHVSDPDDCLRALQRALGGALFLPNPYPAVISIAGNTPRFLLMEVLKRSLGDRVVHLSSQDLDQITSLTRNGLWRLTNARLLLIDIPRRVTDQEKEILISLLYRTSVSTGMQYDPFMRPFSAIPVLFTPDETCSDPTGISDDQTSVQTFMLRDEGRTSLCLHQHLNAAIAQDQIDLFLCWLLDGAYLEDEFRKEPENRLLSIPELS